MSRCLARIANTHWFHREKFPGQPDRPCSFKAKRDGYCFRHHPSDLKRTLGALKTTAQPVLVQLPESVARQHLPELFR